MAETTAPATGMLERLTAEMKSAMKAGRKDRLAVIRMLLSDVKNIDMNLQKPTAEQAVEAYGKKLRKSVEEYEKIGRAAEAEQLKKELAVVDEFLPKKLDAAATAALVEQFLASNAYTEKDAGKATGAFMKLHGGQVEAGGVAPMIRARLAGK